MKRQIFIIALLLSGVTHRLGAVEPSPDVTGMHRLYDFTPVSATNPVVGRVKDCGIEIPVSELRSYVDSNPLPDGSKRATSTLDQKRAQLEQLVDEHFLMWEGFQQKADQTPGIVHMLEITQAMLLRETLVNQEVGAKAKTPEDYQRLSKALSDRIFEQTKITVSNEAYADLKANLKLLKLTPATPPTKTTVSAPPAPPTPPDLSQLTPAVRDRTFATCKIGFVTIGDFLTAYTQIPPDQRPNLEKQEGVDAVLKLMLTNGLLTEEARARGLEKAPIVLEKMQLNRNMMSRMYELDQITSQSVAKIKEPGEEDRLKQWYQDHLKDLYTYKDEKGKQQVVPFEKQHERIEDDYVDNLREKLRADHLNALRKDHKIEIDEKALQKAAL